METILIAHNYSDNSFASMSVDLAHKLAERGHKVIFLSHRPYFIVPKYSKMGSGELIVLSWPTEKRPVSLLDFKFYTHVYYQYKPSLIIGHFVGSNITAIISKILSFGRTKVFIYYHTLSQAIDADNTSSILYLNLLRLRKRIFYKVFSDLVICPSILAQQDLLNTFGAKNSVVVLNPMRDRFMSRPIVGTKNISYLGRLDTCKGVIEMVKSFIEFKDIHPTSELTLSIAGSGSERDVLHSITYKRDDIKMIGTITYDQIDSYLASSYFCIIPSISDNLPTVGLEALMNGTPILLSSSTGLAQHFNNGEGGFIFEPSPVGLSEMFSQVDLAHFDYVSLRSDARAVYLKLFTTEKYCSEIISLLEEKRAIKLKNNNVE